MIFGLKLIKKLVEQNIINEEKCSNLVEYFENYVYDKNSFSEEDRKLIKIENNKGNFDIFSDKDLLNAKRDGIINDDEFTNILIALKNGMQDLTGLECIVKKEYIENDDTLCFKTTPLSKVIILSFLSCGIYNIILSMNYWQTLKDNFGYKISPFWRGICEIFTNFKLFPIFSKYFKNFNANFAPIWFAIIYIICRSHLTFAYNGHKFDIYGIHINIPHFKVNISGGFFLLSQNFNITTDMNSDYSTYIKLMLFGIICLMLILNFGGALIYSIIQNKINKINNEHYPYAPKNNWNITNIVWAAILALLLFTNIISYTKNICVDDKQLQSYQNNQTISNSEADWALHIKKFKATNHNEIDWSSYIQQVEQKIKQNWKPLTTDNSNNTVVKFIVGKNGELLYLGISKSSGIKAVDDAALKTVKISSPFEPLPAEYSGESVPIDFAFDYNMIK